MRFDRFRAIVGSMFTPDGEGGIAERYEGIDVRLASPLVLAYIGGALPLILLICAQPDIPLLHITNLNMIATEIVRSLVGSIGLLCAIPITAYTTAFLITIRPQHKKKAED